MPSSGKCIPKGPVNTDIDIVSANETSWGEMLLVYQCCSHSDQESVTSRHTSPTNAAVIQIKSLPLPGIPPWLSKCCSHSHQDSATPRHTSLTSVARCFFLNQTRIIWTWINNSDFFRKTSDFPIFQLTSNYQSILAVNYFLRHIALWDSWGFGAI